MSTQEIGELIDSVNELTKTVSGKVGEIDQRIDAAEKEFEEFTTVDFPSRVQSAQTVKFFVDFDNGNDSNVGTSSAQAFRTMAPIVERTINGNTPIYNQVDIHFRAGQEHVLTHQVVANERINIYAWDSNSSNPKTLTLKQGFNADGSPVQFAKAPFVHINEAHNGGRNTVFKTAEFLAGHSWPGGDATPSVAIPINAAALRDVGTVKLDGVHVELYDAPLTAQYFSNSMGSYTSIGLILAGNPAFYKKPAGAGSENYCNSPFLLHIYGVSAVPTDIVSGGHVLDEGFTAFGELFDNLDMSNVRSTHSFV